MVTIVKAHQIKPDGTLVVVIPKHIREALKITKGARLVVYLDKGKAVYLPIDKVK